MKISTRMVWVACWAMGVSVAWPQDLGQSVTFSSPAKRLDALAAELTVHTGVTISVHRDVVSEVVAIQVRDVALSELLQQIAAVTSSEVGRDGRGGMQLRRSRELVRRQEREELAERTEAIRAVQRGWEEWIPRIARGAWGHPVFTPGGGRTPVEFGIERTPVGLAIMELTLLIPAEKLAGIRHGERMVFSTHPNRMQIGFDHRAGAILANLVRGQQEYLRQGADLELPPEMEAAMEAGIEIDRQLGLYREENPMTDPVKKAILVASIGQLFPVIHGELLRLELRVYDQAGNVMLDGRMSFGGLTLGAFVPRERLPVQPEPHPTDAQPIALSPLTAEKQQLTPAGMPGRVRPASPKLAEALRRPDLVDPHAFKTSEATMAVAAALGLQLVANFPDSFVPDSPSARVPSISPMGPMQGPGELTIGSWRRTLAASEELAVTKQDGWMLVQPANPVESRRSRINRAALARLIHQTYQEGSTSLEALAEYAAVSPEPGFDSLVNPYVRHWGVQLQGGIQAVRAWNLLRFYGSLSPGQRELLAMGRPIGFATLNPEQRLALERMLFRSDTRFEARLRALGQERGLAEIAALTQSPIHRTYRNEPTELMPDGIPREGSFTLDVRQSHVIRPVNPDGSPLPGHPAQGLDDFALVEAMYAAVELPPGVELPPPVLHAQIGPRQVLSFTFLLAEDTVARGVLRDDKLPSDAPILDLTNLPQALADQLRRYREVYGRMAARMALLERTMRPPLEPRAP